MKAQYDSGAVSYALTCQLDDFVKTPARWRHADGRREARKLASEAFDSSCRLVADYYGAPLRAVAEHGSKAEQLQLVSDAWAALHGKAAIYVVQGHYGYGWEDLCAASLTASGRREARSDLKAYRDNAPGTYRMIERHPR